MASANTSHGMSFVALAGGGSGGAGSHIHDAQVIVRQQVDATGRPRSLPTLSPVRMARYIEDESDSGHTLLVAAGVVAGLLAGAVVAQRMGGWRGMRRLLGKQRAPLLKLVRGALPSGALGAVIDAVGIEQIIGALLGTVPAERRPVAAKKRRRQRGARPG
jgi:hypothetical protein